MSEIEMRKLGRKELLDALADREDEIDRLRLRLVDVEKRLSDREIKIDRAGSIAEASLSLAMICRIFCWQTSIPRHMQLSSKAFARMEKNAA